MAALIFDASSWTERTEAVKIVCNASNDNNNVMSKSHLIIL